MSRCRCWGATSYGLFLPLALFFTQKRENLPSASPVVRLLLDAACQHGSVEEYARKRMTQMAERQRGNKITESVSFYFSTSTTFLFLFPFFYFIFVTNSVPLQRKIPFLVESSKYIQNCFFLRSYDFRRGKNDSTNIREKCGSNFL